MKATPTFGMLFRFSNEIRREDAAAILRLRRRHQLPTLKAERGSYYFEGLILRTR